MSGNIDELYKIKKQIRKNYIDAIKQELVNFISILKEEGYNIYSNTDDINELINIIVTWYEFKYPVDKIKMSEKSIPKEYFITGILPESHLSEMEHLSNNMGYAELMFRIPKRLHPIIECWYKGDDGHIPDDDDLSVETSFFSTDISNTETKKLSIDKYDGSILNTKDEYWFRINYKTINTFAEFPYNIEYDIKNLKKIALTHKYDLIIRKKIFDLISLTLLFSADNFEVGYIRSKKFIEEFNKYIYKLKLSTKPIDSWQHLSRWNSKQFYQIEKYIMSDLKTKTDLNEECGLSFKTICLLKEKNINIEDIYNNSLFSDVYIPLRDKKILEDELKDKKQKNSNIGKNVL